MNKEYEKLLRCVEYVKGQIDGFTPEIALVLGTGLNGFGEHIKAEHIIDYHDINGFPVSTVVGHVGRYIFGYIEDVPVVCMQGRVHYYEGYSMSDVILPIRVMGLLGAKVLFVTNGGGALNRDFRPGDLMIIRDHLSLFIPSPLIGENIEELGVRFPDMTTAYDPELRDIIKMTAKASNIETKEGVYVMLTGPQYETPEEVRLLEVLGGDIVGMSTVPEVIAANHMGIRVCGISTAGNMGAGIKNEVLVHEPREGVDERFVKLVRNSIVAIARTLWG